MTHTCIFNLNIIGSDNGLSPGRRQAIIRTNAGLLLIGPLGTNFSEILIGIQAFSFKKMHVEMSSAKWRTFCHGLNVMMYKALGDNSSFGSYHFFHHIETACSWQHVEVKFFCYWNRNISAIVHHTISADVLAFHATRTSADMVLIMQFNRFWFLWPGVSFINMV